MPNTFQTQSNILNLKNQSFPILNLLKSVLLKRFLKHVSEQKSVGAPGKLFQHCTIRLQKKCLRASIRWTSMMNIVSEHQFRRDILWSFRRCVFVTCASGRWSVFRSRRCLQRRPTTSPRRSAPPSESRVVTESAPWQPSHRRNSATATK